MLDTFTLDHLYRWTQEHLAENERVPFYTAAVILCEYDPKLLTYGWTTVEQIWRRNLTDTPVR